MICCICKEHLADEEFEQSGINFNGHPICDKCEIEIRRG